MKKRLLFTTALFLSSTCVLASCGSKADYASGEWTVLAVQEHTNYSYYSLTSPTKISFTKGSSWAINSKGTLDTNFNGNSNSKDITFRIDKETGRFSNIYVDGETVGQSYYCDKNVLRLGGLDIYKSAKDTFTYLVRDTSKVIKSSKLSGTYSYTYYNEGTKETATITFGDGAAKFSEQDLALFYAIADGSDHRTIEFSKENKSTTYDILYEDEKYLMLVNKTDYVIGKVNYGVFDAHNNPSMYSGIIELTKND